MQEIRKNKFLASCLPYLIDQHQHPAFRLRTLRRDELATATTFFKKKMLHNGVQLLHSASAFKN
jgi:hypothetical protein